jgi:hypothetical protein
MLVQFSQTKAQQMRPHLGKLQSGLTGYQRDDLGSLFYGCLCFWEQRKKQDVDQQLYLTLLRLMGVYYVRLVQE